LNISDDVQETKQFVDIGVTGLLDMLAATLLRGFALPAAVKIKDEFLEQRRI